MIVTGAASFAANAAETDEAPACFDAVVSARAVKQIPSQMPDCGENCIVLLWPWFVDLEVDRVFQGRIPSRRLSVLGFLHTSLAPRVLITWGLRRNKDGGFNAQRYVDKGAARCAADTEPEEPYLRPGEGQTLKDVRESAEREWNRH
jgi:hypothetical protein